MPLYHCEVDVTFQGTVSFDIEAKDATAAHAEAHELATEYVQEQKSEAFGTTNSYYNKPDDSEEEVELVGEWDDHTVGKVDVQQVNDE